MDGGMGGEMGGGGWEGKWQLDEEGGGRGGK